LENKIINPQKEFEKNLSIAISNACFTVRLPDDMVEEYDNKSYEWAEDKKTFGHHYTLDQKNIHARSNNGHSAQGALEYQLGVKFTEWMIGNKKLFNTPDLRPIGLEIGVKAFKAPKNAPIIFKQSHYPEILMCRDQYDKSLYYCLGLFGPSTLNFKEYTCDSLIIDPDLLERGTKTGFYKVDVGKPFTCLEDLKKLAGTKWITKK
jgi:hypothetical protein